MSKPEFTRVVIGKVNNNVPPAEMNTFSAAGDVNGDGFIDYVICGRNGKMVWLQNNGEAGKWEQHLIDEVVAMECGGSLVDLTGGGYLDIINGGDFRSDEVFWWENPGVTGVKWKRRMIAKTGHTQIHDTIIGDITGDGKLSLIFTNQHGEGGTDIYCIPLPKDPTVSPWPDKKIVASGMSESFIHADPSRGKILQPEEGLAVGDIDGDGKNELVCGTHWYKYNGSGWDAHKFARGYITTKCAVGDIDGDGRNEIVLSEGDPCVYGKTRGGKVSWFKPEGDLAGMWEEHVLDDFLFDAHSLQLGDLCGNGRLDVFVGEVGKNDEKRRYVGRLPRLMIFENDGKGGFVKHIIDEGTGIHEGQLIDARNKGVLDIIGKPLQGDGIWNVYVWYKR